PAEEVPESDQTEDCESELEPSSGGREKRVEETSDQSVLSLELNDVEQLMEDITADEQVSYSPGDGGESLAKSDNAVQSAEQYSKDSLAFLEKIKAVKESLKTSMKDSSATVKVVLLPVGQEIIMPFKVDTVLKCLKDHFSSLLGVPPYVLQIRCAGMIIKNHETLLQHGVKPQDIVQVEIFSLHPDLYPIKRIDRSSDASQIITVRVQTGIDQYQEVAVEIIKSDFHKPFLGGFRHKVTGMEYHNAGTQTVPKKIPEKLNAFCRDTQVIVIQTYYRRWHAKVVVDSLKRQKMLRLQWEAQEELRKIREKEEWMKLDYYRRHNPQTKEDFELLYNALERGDSKKCSVKMWDFKNSRVFYVIPLVWRQEELARINQSFTGAERKAALCELLEKETQIIASIGRHRYIAYTANQEASIQAFLDKCSAPKIWRTFDGKIIEMDTQFTIRARELQNIYNCIMLKNISQDERLDVLLTLKHTVKEHECKLTQEILELIDREVDLTMRGVKHENLEGLRKRIATLFFHYIKTPLFNPEVARHLKGSMWKTILLVKSPLNDIFYVDK
ncbi:hypothetical protein E2I00_013600, partial [Balaenoptera physalus]